MISSDDFEYAMENTRVMLAPRRRIETFGNTSFRFFLVSELMDKVGEVRIRDGQIHAERPQIITPDTIAKLLLDGFGEEARGFADWIERQPQHAALLKYGFQFRKSHINEQIVPGTIDEAVDRLSSQVAGDDNPLSAVIQGVDEGWEICLLKFAFDLIRESSGDNLGDFRRRGLI